MCVCMYKINTRIRIYNTLNGNVSLDVERQRDINYKMDETRIHDAIIFVT